MGQVFNTGLVMGYHIDFKRGIEKYGSIEQMPQYPVMKRFAREGHVTVYSNDSDDYTHKLPDNVEHFPIGSKIVYVFLAWVIIGINARARGINYLYCFSGSSIPCLPFVNRLSGAKSILFYGCMFWSSSQSFDYQRAKQGKYTIREMLFRLFERRAIRHADYMIVTSSEITKFVIGSGYNGTILPMKKGVRHQKPSKRFKRNPKRILFAGWLEPIKDPLTAISSFSNFVSDPDAELVICGDGSLKGQCELFASFDKRVKVLGQRHDMPDQYAKAGIFLSTSVYDATSDSIQEAMLHGLSVIATKVGGSKSMIKDGVTGVLVQPRSHESISKAMRYLLSHPRTTKAIGNNAKVYAKEHFDLDKNLDNLVTLMRSEKAVNYHPTS